MIKKRLTCPALLVTFFYEGESCISTPMIIISSHTQKNVLHNLMERFDRPGGVERLWPVLFYWDWIYWFGNMTFSISGGFMATLSLMHNTK